MAKGWKNFGTIGDIDWFLQTVHKPSKELTPDEKRRIRAEQDHKWSNAIKSTYVMPKPHVIITDDGKIIEELDQQSLLRSTKHQAEVEAWWEREKKYRKTKAERNAKRRIAKRGEAIPAKAD